MKIQLRYGDSRTLTFSELAEAAGGALSNFQDGDVVRFSLRRSFSSAFPMLDKTTADDGVTFTADSTTGAVNIADTDWLSAATHHLYGCVWDLERTRNGFRTTVLSGVLDVLADVSR